MSRRILITGAFGQLGEAVIHELHPHFELTATGLSVPENFSHNCDTATLDITDRTSTRNCVKKIDPDVVVHLASHTNVDGCEQNKEKAWQVNVVGTEISSIQSERPPLSLFSSRLTTSSTVSQGLTTNRPSQIQLTIMVRQSWLPKTLFAAVVATG